MNHNPVFKVRPFFDAKYITNGYRYGHSYYKRLPGEGKGGKREEEVSEGKRRGTPFLQTDSKHWLFPCFITTLRNQVDLSYVYYC